MIEPPTPKSQKPRIATLSVASIRSDAGTQTRAAIRNSIVGEYAEALARGEILPRIVVFEDHGEMILGDGFHRLKATQKLGRTEITADVYSGSRQDALLHALGSNRTHGLRRSNADKRHSVILALKEFPDWSDRKIAEVCGVGPDLVGAARKVQLSESDSSSDAPTRVGRDGRKRRTPIARRSSDPRLPNSETAPPHPADGQGASVPAPRDPPTAKTSAATKVTLQGAWAKAKACEREAFCEANAEALLRHFSNREPGWWLRTTPQARGALLQLLIQSERPVEVKHLQVFKDRIQEWIGAVVTEQRAESDPSAAIPAEVVER